MYLSYMIQTNTISETATQIRTMILEAEKYPSQYFNSKETRNLARFIQFAVASSREAVKNADLNLEKINQKRFGVFIGSGIGSMNTIETEHKKLLNRGPKKISPFLIPKIIINEAAGQVSIDLGAKNCALCCVTACATGTNAIGDSMRIIQYGDADIMIAGGTESATTPLSVSGFTALKALSTPAIVAAEFSNAEWIKGIFQDVNG